METVTLLHNQDNDHRPEPCRRRDIEDQQEWNKAIRQDEDAGDRLNQEQTSDQ